MEFRVHLFGQYDSRGGTTAIKCETKAEAQRRYIEEVWTPGDDAELRRVARDAARESYLCAVVLEADDDAGFPPVIPEGGIELDHSYDGPGWVLIPAETRQDRLSMEQEEPISDPAEIARLDAEYGIGFPDFDRLAKAGRIRWVPLAQHPEDEHGDPTNLPAGWLHPRWDDDAYAFILQ